MKKLFYKTIKLIQYSFRINWIQTFRVNFKMLPFKTAMKFPVLVFGKMKFYGSGKILIDYPISSGIIRFGSNYEEFIIPKPYSILFIDGTLKFRGRFTTGLGYSIRIYKNAYLEIGHNSGLGSSGVILCTNRIILGDFCRIGFETNIYDTGFHYIMHKNDHKVTRLNSKPINISNNCWIGNRCTITQGTKTPKYCIVGSNSLCNKDYTTTVPIESIIAGIPAKLIRTGDIRVFDIKTESAINDFFFNHPTENSVSIDDLL